MNSWEVYKKARKLTRRIKIKELSRLGYNLRVPYDADSSFFRNIRV